MRSKGGGGARARQASPRALAIAGGVVLLVVIAVVLGVVLSGGKKSSSTNVPALGNRNWVGALDGSPQIYNEFKGIPEAGLILGNPNAPATLTEFIDLQCPVCKDFENTQFPTLVQKYVRTGKLNVRMEPWSILSAPDSPRGQAATIAASLQNKAFQFAALLYLNQGLEDTGWLTEDFISHDAASVDGMDTRRVLDDQTASEVKNTVNDVDGQASAQNFSATPTLLLNHKGQKAHVFNPPGLPDPAKLQSAIEAAIQG